MAILFHRNFLFQILCKSVGIPRLISFQSTRNLVLDHTLIEGVTLNRTIQEHRLLCEGGLELPEQDRLEFYPNERRVGINKLLNYPAIVIDEC